MIWHIAAHSPEVKRDRIFMDFDVHIKLETANENNASNDQQDTQNARQTNRPLIKSQKTEMVEHKSNDHLSGDDQAERHRYANPRCEDDSAGHKECSKQAAYPGD